MRLDLNDTTVYLVSGLPRSGTSMMMQMLVAGGLRAFTDGLRVPDDSNPRGYFELERVKTLAEDNAWLRDCQGQALKVVSPWLCHLPEDLDYKIIFMDRRLSEGLASQVNMMARMGDRPSSLAEGDARLRDYFAKHLDKIDAWLQARATMRVQHVDHRRCIEAPLACAELVRAFLGLPLDVEDMAASVDSGLYRERTR